MSAALDRDATASVDPTSRDEIEAGEKRPLAFWLVFLAVCMATFLSALDFTSIGTVLPTIVEDLHGTSFTWVGSAFALSSTAFLPMAGGLADIFGRRIVMLGSLAIFALGSAVSGAASSMGMLIAGRTIQGMGSGGVLTLSEIIVADLVPLRFRGKYQGLLHAVWSAASAVGPPVGGALASGGAWRWLFYLNLPLTGIAFGLVLFFLKLRTPKDSFRAKLGRMDWIGNGMVIGSTASIIIALTWAGVEHPWSSYQILVPLIVGLFGLVVFLVYEAKWASNPVVPFSLFESRTSLAGYIATFWHGVAVVTLLYYGPTYFQAAQNASAVQAGVDLFGSALVVAPFAILCGVSVAITGQYLPQNYIGWVLSIFGAGLLGGILRADTRRSISIGVQVPGAIGYGFLYSATSFAVLAPMPLSKNAAALGLFTFVRQFGQTWGITIGSTILQNGLNHRLPAAFISSLPTGVDASYALIPLIHALPEPLRTQVRVAFCDSINVIWFTCAGIGGLGLLTTLAMREVKLHVVTDEVWGFEEAGASAGGASEEALEKGLDEKLVREDARNAVVV